MYVRLRGGLLVRGTIIFTPRRPRKSLTLDQCFSGLYDYTGRWLPLDTMPSRPARLSPPLTIVRLSLLSYAGTEGFMLILTAHNVRDRPFRTFARVDMQPLLSCAFVDDYHGKSGNA